MGKAMKEIWNWLQVAIAALGGWIGWLFGGADGFLYALVAFVVIDCITGVMCAIIDKRLSSEIGAKGIFKKVLIFALVGIGQLIDSQIIKSGSVLRTAVIFFYLSNEGISILENVGYIGLPVPQKLKDVLAQLNSQSGTKQGNKAGVDAIGDGLSKPGDGYISGAWNGEVPKPGEITEEEKK